MPVQARGHTRTISNVRLTAGRDGPRIFQFGRNEPVVVLERGTSPVPVGRTGAASPAQNLPRAGRLAARPAHAGRRPPNAAAGISRRSRKRPPGPPFPSQGGCWRDSSSWMLLRRFPITSARLGFAWSLGPNSTRCPVRTGRSRNTWSPEPAAAKANRAISRCCASTPGASRGNATRRPTSRTIFAAACRFASPRARQEKSFASPIPCRTVPTACIA